MTLYFAFLSACLLQGIAGVDQNEHLIAVAALKEQLSNPPGIDVTFQTSTEILPKYKAEFANRDAPDRTITWIRKKGLESYSASQGDGKNQFTEKWVFDGRTTHEWTFDKFGKAKDVWIRPGSPRPEASERLMSRILGLAHSSSANGLLSYLKDAERNKSITATRTAQGITLRLDSSTEYSQKCQVTATVDPTHDWRLVSWTFTPANGEKEAISESRWDVEEFQEVRDELSGKAIWFPKRASCQSHIVKHQIDVRSVKINQDLVDQRLSHEAPPDGTHIYKVSAAPGATPEMTIAGGSSAALRAHDILVENAKKELDRLALEGEVHDATPPKFGQSDYWITGTCLALAMLCLLWLYRRG